MQHKAECIGEDGPNTLPRCGGDGREGARAGALQKAIELKDQRNEREIRRKHTQRGDRHPC